jgi:hypothetical protein
MKWTLPAAALLVLIGSLHFLWLWQPEEVEGDVLIHLVFARNLAEGRANEYGSGQVSHAGTSPLWVWILALAARAGGWARDPDALFLLARITAPATLAVALWMLWKAARETGSGRRAAAFATLAAGCFPVVVYWCAANPMETGLALLAAVSMLRLGMAVAGGRAHAGLLPLLAVASYLVRPELLVFGAASMVASGAALPRAKWKEHVLRIALGALAVLLVAAAFTAATGHPLFPNAASARRIALLHFDARPIPVLNLPASPDAAIFLTLAAPLLWGCLRELRNPPGPRRAAALQALGVCAFSLLFFSFYYPSTWRGRYLLPALFTLLPSALAGLRPLPLLHRFPILPALYYAAFSAILLFPLARHARAPLRREQAESRPPTYWTPGATHRSLLIQEVQGALFHPRLHYLSTDGLISMEAVDAYRRNLTVLEFVLEQKPDLIGPGRFYLRDPEGFEARLTEAVDAGKDTQIGPVSLRYLGQMKGGGSILEASYPAPADIPVAP